MESGDSSDEAREHAREIGLACERCNTLIRQLRAFGRRRGGAATTLDVDQTIRGLERALGHVAGETFKVVMRLAARNGEVMADAADLEQLVLGLVLVTREGTPRGGTTTILTRTYSPTPGFRERFPFVPPANYVEIAVTDEGSGLGESAKRFLAAPATESEGGAGAGLGLAMAYDTVKRLAGYIVEDDIPGYGVALCVLLPSLASSPATAEGPSIAEPRAEEPQTRAVLLVDDDDAVRRILCMALTRSGFDVIEASNAKEALEAAASAAAVDLLVTDITMPGMGGVELARRLRRLDATLPVVFLSGIPQESLEAEGEAPTSFVEKPFTSAEFIERVRTVLHRRQS